MIIWVVVISVICGYDNTRIYAMEGAGSLPIWADELHEFNTEEEALLFIKQNYKENHLNGGIKGFYRAEKFEIVPNYEIKTWTESPVQRQEKKLIGVKRK